LLRRLHGKEQDEELASRRCRTPRKSPKLAVAPFTVFPRSALGGFLGDRDFFRFACFPVAVRRFPNMTSSATQSQIAPAGPSRVSTKKKDAPDRTIPHKTTQQHDTTTIIPTHTHATRQPEAHFKSNSELLLSNLAQATRGAFLAFFATASFSLFDFFRFR
jgi:hypothetical protein